MRKGLVVLHGDFGEYWLQAVKRLNIKTLGLHANPFQISVDGFLSFVEKQRKTIGYLEESGVSVEYDLHALNYLLPRSLFKDDATLFRINEKGERVADYNGCPSSERALKIIEENSYFFAEKLKQKSETYHIWTDDDMGGNVRCHCDNCRRLTATEQDLIFSRAILKGLRKYEENARLSFLLYGKENFFKKLPEGIFVEFAPFKRRHDIPLTEGNENAFFRRTAKKLIATYGRERVEVLEYFLSFDYVGFKNRPDRVSADVNFYRNLGVETLSTFIVCKEEGYLLKENFEGIEKYMLL